MNVERQDTLQASPRRGLGPRPAAQHPELPDESPAMAAHSVVLLPTRPRTMDLLPTHPTHHPPLPVANLFNDPTTTQQAIAALDPFRQPGFLPLEYYYYYYLSGFYPLPGAANFFPSLHVHPSSPLSNIAQTEVRGMRVPVDPAVGEAASTMSSSSSSPSPGTSMFFDNVGAIFHDYQGEPGQFALDRGDSPPGGGQECPVNAVSGAVPSCHPPSDNDAAWHGRPLTDGTRIGEQNSRFSSYSGSPGTIGGGLPTQPGPSSCSTISMKDVTSPSDSTSSWTHLTPTTGSPGPGLGPVPTRSTPPQETFQEVLVLRREEIHNAFAERKVGPAKDWTIPKQTKRGRKPGSGAVLKDRKDSDSKKPRQVAKRLGPLKDADRKQARLTKKHGACRICHYKKSKCPPIDPEHPERGCTNCASLKLHPSPCFRYAITDASLYRQQKKPYPMWTKRWQSMDMKDITNWESNETRTITVTQIFLHAPYKLRVRRYIPEDGDQLERFWFDGNVRRRMDIPPYAIANLEEAAASIDQMMKKETVNYFSSTIGWFRGTGHPGLIWTTYDFAYRHCIKHLNTDEGKLLNETLKLWVACRLTSFSEKIISKETLDMTFVDDPSSPYKDRIPVPPIMVAQQELIVFSRYLQPLSVSVLTQLDRLIAKRKHADWLTIYLTLFLLLHSCALLTERDAEYAQRIGLKTQFANPESIRGHHSGALTLLAHFHHISGGSKPFEMASERRLHELRGNASFTPEQERFIEESAMCANMMSTELRAARESRDPGNALYWVSQLYDKIWIPDKMH